MFPTHPQESRQAVDLYDAALDALWRYDPVRDELGFIDLRVEPGGKLMISGNVRSSLIRDGVLQTLRQVPGVQAVEDRMIPDLEIEICAAQALASDQRTRSIPPGSIAIRSHLGAVKLSGKADETMLEASVDVVRGVQGVRTVKLV